MNEIIVSREKQDLFLKDLRQQTGESHLRLEENKYSKAILEPSVSMADYQVYIARMYGVTKACENDVFPEISALMPDLNKRYRSGLITEDLSVTGLADRSISNLPVHHFNVSSAAEALGVLYVLEGSTLGGKVLYRHIHQYLGLDAQSGASYFYGYGTETGQMWKNFQSVFTSYAIAENCEKEIIAGAVSAFSAIDTWLNEAEIKL